MTFKSNQRVSELTNKHLPFQSKNIRQASMNVNRKASSSSSSPIKHLISVITMASVCAILLVALIIHSADAHSLIDNSIRGAQDHPYNNKHHQQQNKQVMITMQNGNQNRCQSGWMWFNNKCWVATQSRRDYAHAIELCKKMHNATLPTIHSEDENEFLRQNIDLTNSPIWLYARHNHQYNTTRWLDRTNVNYTRWDAGQPSDKSSLVCIKTEENWYMKKAEPVDGQTECVSFWEDAKWGTQVGCQVLLPVVCERKLAPISRYTDGPNGTTIQMSSNQQQYDPQQMNQLSGAMSLSHNINTLIYIASIISASTVSYYTQAKPIL